MCVNGLSIWEKGTYEAAGAEQPMQATYDGAKGSAPDMLVRI